VLVEICGREFDGFACEQGGVTFWTVRRITQAIARQSHNRIALAADDVYFIAHGDSYCS
jgi:hypothetical protein